jgi:alpha-glucosidase (family GH31 glycosyl hydrolase)
MELAAFMPFYRSVKLESTIIDSNLTICSRNHYANGKHPQEAYVWPTVAEASRRAISIRYSLLPYMYTLLYYAHTRGNTMMRALAWEFPDDRSLRAVDNQFLLGPAILVTPVLERGARTVKGVFPGIGQGTRWYDWYNLKEVTGVGIGENVTIPAPLEHIPLHIRGGSILALQEPGYTTTETRLNPLSLLVALDDNGFASGSLYLDDGESLEPRQQKFVEVGVPSKSHIVVPSKLTIEVVHVRGQQVVVKVLGSLSFRTGACEHNHHRLIFNTRADFHVRWNTGAAYGRRRT